MVNTTSNSAMTTKLFKLWIVGLLATGFLFSCKKDKGLTPEEAAITVKEVGLNNSKIAYSGNDLHIDATVTAPAKIVNIKVQITLAESNYGWDFVKTYTGAYAGSKNADFHEHIDVPESARAGTYTLLIIVTDELGRKTQAKADFTIIKDLSLPRITNVALKATSASILNISGGINAPNKIAKLVVEVQSSAWTREFIYTDPEMINQTSFPLNKNIDVSSAPAGHYHINISVHDQAGKHALYAFHMDR
jgi:hypothetical protein